MPLQATSGAASQDAFGGNGVAVVPTYIEDVFSTTLFTGTNTNPNTITNGIDLSTKGGLVWIKERNAGNHSAWDTARGVKNLLIPNLTNENLNIPVTYPAYPTYGLQSFNTTGFTLGKNWEGENAASSNIVSWTFRKQPKFFDVVTFTGNGANRTIAHNLGSAPGCIIVKKTNAAKDWAVYHRSTGNTKYLSLNTTAAQATSSSYWNNTDPTSTVFTVGIDGDVNANGDTYVAYLFAHDAGGFGLTGTDNVISCGSFTTNGSGVATINLGYEPQFVLFKRTDSAGHSWEIIDTMRGFSVNSNGTTGNVQRLNPNSSGAETNSSAFEMYLTSTGFATNQYFYNATYIYVAIRRGPMKVPTTGTSVFAPVTQTDGGTVTTNFPVDLTINGDRPSSWVPNWFDRLRGGSSNTYAILNSASTNAEAAGSGTGSIEFQNNTGYRDYWNNSGLSAIYWNFRRAPSFFDVVCYTGTGSSQNVAHNLAVVPELIIIKRRNSTGGWEAAVPSTTAGSFFVGTSGAPISLNTTNGNGGQTAYAWASNTGTSTYFNPSGVFWNGNVSSGTYVAYLFATCAGVSKVGSYTGTGTTLQIDCGFTGGARFVLIKRTDSAGDWYVWDTARGIVSGNDSYLLLNSTAAEVTNTDYIDTYSAGFEISSTAPAAINANGGSFIFFAVA